MTIVVLGAGFSGLTAAYRLAKAGHKVAIIEKNSTPGGAAGGFKKPGWDWYLDYTYHHSFTNEQEILKLAKEIGFAPFLTLSPETASLYSENKETTENKDLLFNYLFGTKVREYKLDSAIDLLKFSRLGLWSRWRTGLVLAAIKFGPYLRLYDKVLAKEFLSQTMGKRACQELWKPLFLKKFSHFYRQINMGFFWARLRRTAKLTYPPGGYQALANHLAKAAKKQGAQIFYKTKVKAITQKKGKFVLTCGTKTIKADKLVNTLPTPLFLKLEKAVLPKNYRRQLMQIKYLGAQNIILKSGKKTLPRTYWLSLAAKNNRKSRSPGLDYMVLVQQTNFVAPKHYHNQHLLYLATYTNTPKPFYLKDKKVAKNYQIIKQHFLPYGQPLYTPQFVKNKPDYQTPVRNLYFANMELTYPYDRGTNQAVRCGNRIAEMI